MTGKGFPLVGLVVLLVSSLTPVSTAPPPLKTEAQARTPFAVEGKDHRREAGDQLSVLEITTGAVTLLMPPGQKSLPLPGK